MKKTLITTAICFLAIAGFSQTKSDSAKIKYQSDSAFIDKIAKEIYVFAHEKNIPVQYFEALGQVLNAYLDEKKKQK